VDPCCCLGVVPGEVGFEVGVVEPDEVGFEVEDIGDVDGDGDDVGVEYAFGVAFVLAQAPGVLGEVVLGVAGLP